MIKFYCDFCEKHVDYAHKLFTVIQREESPHNGQYEEMEYEICASCLRKYKIYLGEGKTNAT